MKKYSRTKERDYQKMKNLLMEGVKGSVVSRMFNKSSATVYRIKRSTSFADYKKIVGKASGSYNKGKARAGAYGYSDNTPKIIILNGVKYVEKNWIDAKLAELMETLTRDTNSK